MPYKYDLILYDLDGTLIDSREDIADAIIYTLKNFNKTAPDYSAIMSGQCVGALAYLKTLFPAEDEAAKAISAFKEYYTANIVNKTLPFPCVTETLRTLHEQLKQIILTDKPAEYTAPTLKGLKLEHYFQAVYSGDSFSQRKPHPQPILSVLDTFDISPQRALIVGDSKNDILCGKNADIDTCAVSYGYHRISELKEFSPTHTIDTFDKLLEIIKAE